MSHDLRSLGESFGRSPFRYVCIICHEEFDSYEGLGAHWARRHKMVAAETVLPLTAWDRTFLHAMRIGDA